MSHTKIILSRVLQSVPALIGVVVVTFVLTRMLPGDPAAYFAGPTAAKASIEETRVRLGLDGSVAEQFVTYISKLAVGDLGKSLTSGQTVLDDLKNRLPASLELTTFAILLGIAVGVPLGIGSAIRPGGWTDRLCDFLSTIGQAMPTFFLGLFLIFIFYFLLEWSPAPLGRLSIYYSGPPFVTGFWLIDAAVAGDGEVFSAVFSQLILPVITLALFALGPFARMTRAAMIEVLNSDFLRTARAAGLPRRKVIWTYAFRNAMVPILNASGMVFSFTLGASVLVEKVFGWPGVGAYAIDAVLASDFAPVQGFVLTMAVLYLVINLLIDVSVNLLDPKVKLDG